MELLPLELLATGEQADVVEVAGSPSWVSRLAELGIRAGTRVQVLRSGSPCILLVGGSRLSLRGEQAMQIMVQPVPATVPLPHLRAPIVECS
ncbi:MAG: ferrous iron transport protein A [Gemmataceae bacterium]|nr:ferrous iron transport protein A [Gemmataceae bacterium]